MEERIYFTLTVYSPSWRDARTGSQGRNPGAGTETETMEKHCLLACFLWFVQPNFWHHPRVALLQRAAHSHTNPESRKWPTDLSDGRIFLTETSFSPVTPACVKVTSTRSWGGVGHTNQAFKFVKKVTKVVIKINNKTMVQYEKLSR